MPAQAVDDDCAPLVSPNNSRAAPPYSPCGVKAASLFNDYVELLACADSSCLASQLRAVPTSKDIASGFARTHRAWSNTSVMDTGHAWLYDAWSRAQAPSPAPPPSPPSAPSIEGFVAADPSIEDFVSWMRASPMATLRKPLLRIEQDLPAGEYVLRLANRYDVRTFRGSKSLLVAPYSSSVGGDPGALVAVLAGLCLASLLFAAAIAAATCRSSQPARCEAL